METGIYDTDPANAERKIKINLRTRKGKAEAKAMVEELRKSNDVRYQLAQCLKMARQVLLLSKGEWFEKVDQPDKPEAAERRKHAIHAAKSIRNAVKEFGKTIKGQRGDINVDAYKAGYLHGMRLGELYERLAVLQFEPDTLAGQNSRAPREAHRVEQEATTQKKMREFAREYRKEKCGRRSHTAAVEAAAQAVSIQKSVAWNYARALGLNAKKPNK